MADAFYETLALGLMDSPAANCSNACGAALNTSSRCNAASQALADGTDMFLTIAPISALLCAIALCCVHGRQRHRECCCCPCGAPRPAVMHTAAAATPRSKHARAFLALQVMGMMFLHRKFGSMPAVFEDTIDDTVKDDGGAAVAAITYGKLMPMVVFLPLFGAAATLGSPHHLAGAVVGFVHSAVCCVLLIRVTRAYFYDSVLEERDDFRDTEYPSLSVLLSCIFATHAGVFGTALVALLPLSCCRTSDSDSNSSAGPLPGFDLAEEHVRALLKRKVTGGDDDDDANVSTKSKRQHVYFQQSPRMLVAVSCALALVGVLALKYCLYLKHTVAEGLLFCFLSMNVNGPGVPPLGANACKPGSCMDTLWRNANAVLPASWASTLIYHTPSYHAQRQQRAAKTLAGPLSPIMRGFSSYVRVCVCVCRGGGGGGGEKCRPGQHVN